MTKKELRKALLARRLALDPARREAGAAALTERLLALPEVRRARRIFVYVGVKEEVPTLPWIRRWLADGVQVLVPRIEGDRIVAVPLLSEADLVPGSFGIPTAMGPASDAPVDLVVAPGAGFTARCERIGLGKAYYDGLLTRLPAGFVCAVAWDEQIVDEIPMEPHDRLMDAVVTPTRTFRRSTAPGTA